jgi:hypothetical protein
MRRILRRLSRETHYFPRLARLFASLIAHYSVSQ